MSKSSLFIKKTQNNLNLRLFVWSWILFDLIFICLDRVSLPADAAFRLRISEALWATRNKNPRLPKSFTDRCEREDSSKFSLLSLSCDLEEEFHDKRHIRTRGRGCSPKTQRKVQYYFFGFFDVEKRIRNKYSLVSFISTTTNILVSTSYSM